MPEEFFNPIIYRNALALVRQFVLQNSGSMHDVEDVMQDGLLAFFQSLSRPDFVLTGKPENYIVRTCKNIWLIELSGRKNTKLSGNKIGEDVIDDDWLIKSKERKERLIAIIEKNIKLLSTKCQKLFEHKRDGLTCIEIAAELKLKNSQIAKDKHFTCKKRLRSIIRKDKDYLDLFKND